MTEHICNWDKSWGPNSPDDVKHYHYFRTVDCDNETDVRLCVSPTCDKRLEEPCGHESIMTDLDHVCSKCLHTDYECVFHSCECKVCEPQ